MSLAGDQWRSCPLQCLAGADGCLCTFSWNSISVLLAFLCCGTPTPGTIMLMALCCPADKVNEQKAKVLVYCMSGVTR